LAKKIISNDVQATVAAKSAEAQNVSVAKSSSMHLHSIQQPNIKATNMSSSTKQRKNNNISKQTVNKVADVIEQVAPTQIKVAAAKADVIKKTTKKKAVNSSSDSTIAVHKTLQITFQIQFHTQYGQSLSVLGNHPILGNNDIAHAVPMQYLHDGAWSIGISIPDAELLNEPIIYNYVLKNADGSVVYDWGTDKQIEPATIATSNLQVFDSWNHAGYTENAFYSVPFQQVLLKANHTEVSVAPTAEPTHLLKVKAPLLAKGQTLCLLGSSSQLGKWNTEQPVLLARKADDVYFTCTLNLSDTDVPIAYKYGVYDVQKKQFVGYEGGENRILLVGKHTDTFTIVNDGFAVLPNQVWKGTGIAIPVFSLRSHQSLGVGEFADLPLLVDWCQKVGLKLLQILPINDTTATHTWVDSYPYAAISAFALHPMYLRLSDVVWPENIALLASVKQQQEQLNALKEVDYEAVNQLKISILKQIYPLQKEKTFATADYQQYFQQNKHWLVPYGVFCFLRDEYHTSDFNQWPAYRHCTDTEIAALASPSSAAFSAIAFHFFVQYHLHLQLKAATKYAHDHGIIVKGDIAIGIYRYGADAWQNPQLFHMQLQAGAPPDSFAVKGQNWGFPTYNWEKMRNDGFAWWKQRFEQMSYYFDAFRIDHILGFFRIWSIPMHAVEGIMGYFVPAIPVHVDEFQQKGIWFNYDRFTKPFINNDVVDRIFGDLAHYVKTTFLSHEGFGNYSLLPFVNTQRKVEKHLSTWNKDAFTSRVRLGLFDLISNVLLFEVEGSHGKQYHFRFSMGSTLSFQFLDGHTQYLLNELYVNYFFRRQDDFWMHEALQKLPALKSVTNMLICGEDLGLVPECVPDVMKQLGLLSLEIQRMPKDPKKQFFHPNDAPYLSVVTPSTHDMSTIRGWWEEDRTVTQQFYNHELGQWGIAPQYCEAWINKAIIHQHLYSPAMWSVFQLQDLLGSDAELRRQNPNDERINVPANPQHYWRYRMHFSLEELLNKGAFNSELANAIVNSGRK